jgi:hypothetical protein
VAVTLGLGLAFTVGDGPASAASQQGQKLSPTKKTELRRWYGKVATIADSMATYEVDAFNAVKKKTAIKVGFYCDEVGADATTLKSHPAPVAEVNKPFESGVSDDTVGARLCRNGLTKKTAATMINALKKLLAGGKLIKRAAKLAKKLTPSV